MIRSRITRVVLQEGVSVLLYGIARVVTAVPIYTVDPGIVGSNIDGDLIAIATGITTTDAFQGQVIFSDMKHVELPSRYNFRINFAATGIGLAMDSSFDHILNLLDENGNSVGDGLSSSWSSGPDSVSASWSNTGSPADPNDPPGNVTFHGFSWNITPDIIATLPAQLDINFQVRDFSFTDEGVIVGAWDVPEPSTLALLSLGFIGIGAARKLKKH